jgi:enoyl-CoA hydratase
MPIDAVRYRLDDTVGVIGVDDGKVNAVSRSLIDQLNTALDRAEEDAAHAVVVAGRTGCFSAGFDLTEIRQGVEAAMELRLAGGKLAVRLFSFPAPVVLAVTGHALALGAVLCCSADERIGADGDFKLGLNEVAIGLPLPEFAVELAYQRLSHHHVTRAVTLAEIYSPAGAVDAGFLDRVVPASQVVDEALARAKALAETLDPTAYRATKQNLRGPSMDRLRRSLSQAPPTTQNQV